MVALSVHARVGFVADAEDGDDRLAGGIWPGGILAPNQRFPSAPFDLAGRLPREPCRGRSGGELGVVGKRGLPSFGAE